jgi:hypothetical protein
VRDRLAVRGLWTRVLPPPLLEPLQLPAVPELQLLAVPNQDDGVVDISFVAKAPERRVPSALPQKGFAANTRKTRELTRFPAYGCNHKVAVRPLRLVRRTQHLEKQQESMLRRDARFVVDGLQGDPPDHVGRPG